MALFDFASATTTSGATGSLQVSVSNNANRILYAFISNSNKTLGVTGVTANGRPMSRVPGFPLNGQGTDITQDVWFLLAPDVGTYNIAVTNNGNDSLFMIEALSAYNVNQTTPHKAPLHALDYAQTTTVSVAAASASDLVVDFDTVSYGAAVTFTNPAPQTNRAQTHSQTYRSSSISTSPGAVGNVTMTSNRTGINQPPSDYSYSAFVINDGGSVATDTTPPNLTSPTATGTGTTTASGTVTTDDGTGTLYWMASTNATETAATVKGSTNSRTVTASGSQSVSVSGLSASTTYYMHYCQVDPSGNTSAVVNSAQFTTGSAADTTPPTLSAPSAAASGSNGVTWSVTTNEGNGALYALFTTNATETAATVLASQQHQSVTATGAQTGSTTGLQAATTYYGHFVHTDAAGNASAVVNTASFQTAVASNATLTTAAHYLNNGQLRANAAVAALNIYNAATGALLVRKTGLTTDAAGKLTVSDPTLYGVASVAYETVFASNSRRLPVGAPV